MYKNHDTFIYNSNSQWLDRNYLFDVEFQMYIHIN